MWEEDDVVNEAGKKGESGYEKRLKKLRILKERHKGKWITIEDFRKYYDKARALPDNGIQDIGERRQLRIELQEKFGIAEVEAINILNGYHVQEYVQKYDNIKNLRIPNSVSVKERVYINVDKNMDYDFEERD